MAKRTIKINIKLPAGVVATKELTTKATAAAQAVVESVSVELVEAQKLAKELAAKGLNFTAEELMSRKKKGRGRAKTTTAKAASGVRTRTVLSDEQRQQVAEDLKAGAKIAATAEKYGVSTATVMNIKTDAGLTKTRK